MKVIVKEIINDTTLLVATSKNQEIEVKVDEFIIAEMQELLTYDTPILLEYNEITKQIVMEV